MVMKVLPNQDNVLQVVSHTWNNAPATTVTTYPLATGSDFTFTPKSATSDLYISCKATLQVLGTTSAGGNVSIRHDGVAITQETLSKELGIYATAPSSTNIAGVICHEGVVASGNKLPRTIALHFAKYNSAATTSVVMNVGSTESSITVIEVEKA